MKKPTDITIAPNQAAATNKTTKTTFRIGQIVPSSNTTMETEIPAMLRPGKHRA